MIGTVAGQFLFPILEKKTPINLIQMQIGDFSGLRRGQSKIPKLQEFFWPKLASLM